jgi:hypothetical protein
LVTREHWLLLALLHLQRLLRVQAGLQEQR